MDIGVFLPYLLLYLASVFLARYFVSNVDDKTDYLAAANLSKSQFADLEFILTYCPILNLLLAFFGIIAWFDNTKK